MRLVLVSFAIMGWAFYEMSGGADFTPPKPPQNLAQSPEPGASRRSQQTATLRIPGPAPTTQPLLTSRTTAAATDLRASQAKPLNTERRAQLVSARVASMGQQIQGSGDAFAVTGAPESIAATLEAAEALLSQNAQPLGLGGLEAGLTSDQGAAANAPATLTRSDTNPEAERIALPPANHWQDRRTIRGSRVNMRQGPGTTYPILTRLLAGDEVIVVDDNGAGWLQLRTADRRHIGWIAASLVSRKGS